MTTELLYRLRMPTLFVEDSEHLSEVVNAEFREACSLKRSMANKPKATPLPTRDNFLHPQHDIQISFSVSD